MISVLMCTYNRERYLKRAIDSVLNQTYGQFEFIVVDDGSTDNSETIIKSYEDSRIKYFPLSKNSFYCYAANYGLAHCNGEYVAFMNSDDVWMPDKLEKQIYFMEENSQYGACFTAVTLIDDNGETVINEACKLQELFKKQYNSQKDCLQFFLKHGNSLCHPSALVKKDVLDKVGGFNLMYCQLADFDLWIRVVTETPIYVFEEPLTQFRWDIKSKEQISSVTKEKSIRVFNEQILIRKHLIERLSDEKLIEFFGDQFKNTSSFSHLELEFEKAFLLTECINEAPELKVLGIEKLECVMQMPGAMETLRKHFGMDIFDLYSWNKEHMYKSPWLMEEFLELKQTIEQQGTVIEQIQQQVEQKIQDVEQQRNEIERQMDEIEQQKNQIQQQKDLIETYANSTSWKITEPFRNFTRWFKR